MKNHLKDFYNYLIDKDCKDVCVYDLTNEERPCDFIYIVTSEDFVANKNLALAIMNDFEMQTYPEGFHKGEWFVFDFNQCVLHLFVGAAREKYSLDKLWQSKKIAV